MASSVHRVSTKAWPQVVAQATHINMHPHPQYRRHKGLPWTSTCMASSSSMFYGHQHGLRWWQHRPQTSSTWTSRVHTAWGSSINRRHSSTSLGHSRDHSYPHGLKGLRRGRIMEPGGLSRGPNPENELFSILPLLRARAIRPLDSIFMDRVCKSSRLLHTTLRELVSKDILPSPLQPSPIPVIPLHL